MEHDAAKLLGETLDGWRVVDAEPSHVDSHGTRELVGEALGKLEVGALTGSGVFTIRFPRAVGVSRCVETSATDDVFYAVRRPRTNLSRLVRNRVGISTDILTIVLLPHRDSRKAVCVTAYLGPPAPPEPTDAVRNRSLIEYERAYAFWIRHALTVMPNELDDSTATTVCPWPSP